MPEMKPIELTDAEVEAVSGGQANATGGAGGDAAAED